jgi:hypothetical protein
VPQRGQPCGTLVLVVSYVFRKVASSRGLPPITRSSGRPESPGPPVSPDAAAGAFSAINATRPRILCAVMPRIPARSIIALAAKAIAAGTAISQAWEVPLADVDWPEQRERLLIEAVLTAAWIPNPFAKPSV